MVIRQSAADNAIRIKVFGYRPSNAPLTLYMPFPNNFRRGAEPKTVQTVRQDEGNNVQIYLVMAIAIFKS